MTVASKPKRSAWIAALGLAAAVMGWSGDASALQWENEGAPNPDGVIFIYFYPYRSVFLDPDPGYAFDDDPLTAFSYAPYDLPIVVKRPQVTRGLVAPRTSFVTEMTRSTDGI